MKIVHLYPVSISSEYIHGLKCARNNFSIDKGGCAVGGQCREGGEMKDAKGDR